MSRNSTAKQFAQNKRRRRQWITFVRMCRYGVNNFSRNAWLTVAATAVMTITLLIIFVTVAAQNILADTTTEVGKKIERSIYLKTDTPVSEANNIVAAVKKLDNVESATYTSPEQARKEFIEQNKKDSRTLDALKNASNKLPGTVRITLQNVNDTKSIVSYVEKDTLVKKYMDPNKSPTFMGKRKNPTETIAKWTDFAQKFGLVMSVIFVSISSLIIFNTIRMAIFNRKEEIQMMKLIGANRSFIRGPFVVEAVVYGFIAALFATGLGMLILYAMNARLVAFGVSISPTISFITTFLPFILLGMIFAGALIGTVSALFATRRYLKI